MKTTVPGFEDNTIMKTRHTGNDKLVSRSLNNTGYMRPVVHIQQKLLNHDQTKVTGITAIFFYSWLYVPFLLILSSPVFILGVFLSQLHFIQDREMVSCSFPADT